MVDYVTLRDGVRLEYVEEGDPYGMPVVFLHGVTESCRSFEAVMRRLPTWMRAISVSLRGHGRSSRPEGAYHFSAFSEDLAQLLDALDIPSALIVGHSLGSCVAQRFAIDHRKRVIGLVLIGASPALAEALGDDFRAELNRIAVPTLLVWGGGDAVSPYSDQLALRAAIPRSQLLVYPGAGHAMHLEDPATFAGDVVAFGTEAFINARFPTPKPRPSAYDGWELPAAS